MTELIQPKFIKYEKIGNLSISTFYMCINVKDNAGKLTLENNFHGKTHYIHQQQ